MSYRRPDEASATSDEDDGLGVLDRHDGRNVERWGVECALWQVWVSRRFPFPLKYCTEI